MDSRPTTSPAAAKAALRARMLAARAALPPSLRAAAARRIRAQLRGVRELWTAERVLAYAAIGAEVDLDDYLAELANRHGGGLHLPWVDGDELLAARVDDLQADLRPGWRGVREPAPEGRAATPLAELDAVIAPGVAFDRLGHRLGYGGGHFDRLLAGLRADTVVVGVAFDVQVVDDVPVEAHDVSVDVVVTESRTLRLAHTRGEVGDRPPHGP